MSGPTDATDATDRTDATDTTPNDLPRWTRVAAYALCVDDEDRVLLCRVAPGYPSAGEWTLPGGGVAFGEGPAAAAIRELAEETGLIGEVQGLALVDSRVGPARPERGYGPWHGVRIVYRVAITGGELRDELDESTDRAAWISRAAAPSLPLVDLVEVALKALDES